MTDKDIHHLAVDILDIAVRCHFTKTGIEAVEVKLRGIFQKATREVEAAPAASVEAAPNPNFPIEAGKVSTRAPRKARS